MEPESTQNLFGLIFLFVMGYNIWNSIPPREVREHGKRLAEQASERGSDARP